MRFFLPALFAAACVAGCAHGQAQFSSGAVSSAPGATAGVSVQGGGSTAAALVGLGIAAVLYNTTPDGTGTTYSSDPFMAVTGGARPPPLAPGRRVNEQDCSRPIEDPSANLKCR